MKTLLIVLFSYLFLLGCGSPAVTNGTITNKTFTPAHVNTYTVQDYTTMCQTTYSYDSKGNVTPTTSCNQVWIGSHEVSENIGDVWTLNLRDNKGNTGRVEISSKIFDQANIGDTYDSKTNEVIAKG